MASRKKREGSSTTLPAEETQRPKVQRGVTEGPVRNTKFDEVQATTTMLLGDVPNRKKKRKASKLKDRPSVKYPKTVAALREKLRKADELTIHAGTPDFVGNDFYKPDHTVTQRILDQASAKAKTSGVVPQGNSDDKTYMELIRFIHAFGNGNAMHTITLAWLVFPHDDSWINNGGYRRWSVGSQAVKRTVLMVTKLVQEGYVRRFDTGVIKLTERGLIAMANIYNNPVISLQRDCVAAVLSRMHKHNTANGYADVT